MGNLMPSRQQDRECSFSADETAAHALDEQDPLAAFRERFFLPGRGGNDDLYFAGHSLGLMPRLVKSEINKELERWSSLGVEAHFKGDTAWYWYADNLRGPSAELLGALPHEVVVMNGLTVNLNLMLTTFYRPSPERHAVLVENSPFSSDAYAITSHIRHHGYDPCSALIELAPRTGEHTLRGADVENFIHRRGHEIALVMLGSVNYLTGQAFDIPRITSAARRSGCVVGFDLAHSAGNLPHLMHDWDVDFAVWCTYKYLNAGPGALAGCFVHERHCGNLELPRLAGWWGNDPSRRFLPSDGSSFSPQPGAAGWQISNPSVLAMAPLKVSLEIFQEVGIHALRRKSVRLTGYLEYLIDRLADDRVEIITPRDPEQRGCQLSLRLAGGGPRLVEFLYSRGVVVDLREPDVLRVAPVPLYNSYHDVWQFCRILDTGLATLR